MSKERKHTGKSTRPSMMPTDAEVEAVHQAANRDEREAWAFALPVSLTRRLGALTDQNAAITGMLVERVLTDMLDAWDAGRAR